MLKTWTFKMLNTKQNKKKSNFCQDDTIFNTKIYITSRWYVFLANLVSILLQDFKEKSYKLANQYFCVFQNYCAEYQGGVHIYWPPIFLEL